MSDTEFKHVKFLRWHGAYSAGQWATFLATEADRLVANKLAVYHDPSKESEAPPKRSNKMVTK